MPYQVRFRALRINPERFDLAAIEREATEFTETLLKRIIEEARVYPPPTGGKYVRTGMLFGGWKPNVRRAINALEGTITNTATDRKTGKRYMPRVQGPAGTQLAQHAATGWLRIDEVAAKYRNEYRRGLQAIYTKHIRRAA